MAVTSIPKGRHVRCRHAGETGCSIYADRPAPCREWSCAWLRGHPEFLERDRPDLIGIVASVVGRKEVSLSEGALGALSSQSAVELVARLVAGGETVTMLPVSGRPSVTGPLEGVVRRRMARLEKRMRRESPASSGT